MAYVDHISVDGVQYDIRDAEAVSFEQEQTLTNAQRERARANIGAGSETDVADLKSQKVNKPMASPNGKAGQLLRTNGDGTTSWVDQGLPTDEQTADAISAWLDEHPEATTTVLDGSLTYPKFAEGVLGIVTPQMFGGKGDGVADDTLSIKAAITYAKTNGRVLYIPKGVYNVEETIAFGDKIAIQMDTQAVIKAVNEMAYVASFVVESYSAQRLSAQNIKVDGNGLAVGGVYVNAIVQRDTISISGLSAINCTDTGVVFDTCEGGIFAAISGVNNGTGIKILGCNNAKFYSLSAYQNTGDGIFFSHTPSGTSGACFVYGVHAEQNGGYGLHFDGAGLYTIYSGWLEANTGTQLYAENNAKCNLYGLRFVWGDGPFAEIYSDYVCLRDIETQGGIGAIYTPVVVGSSVVDNVQTAVSHQWNNKAEMLLDNLISGGDMQGSGGFNIYYCTYTYKDTTRVDSGKTYSLKCVLNTNNGFTMNKDGTADLTVGMLYKVTARIYVEESDCSFRVFAGNNSNNTFVYGVWTDVEHGKWVDIIGYFYAWFAGPYRIGFASNNSAKPQNGDTIYVSELYCQLCPERKMLATKQIGQDLIYENVNLPMMS